MRSHPLVLSVKRAFGHATMLIGGVCCLLLCCRVNWLVFSPRIFLITMKLKHQRKLGLHPLNSIKSQPGPADFWDINKQLAVIEKKRCGSQSVQPLRLCGNFGDAEDELLDDSSS